MAHGAGRACVSAVVAVPLTLLLCVALARAVATANVRLLTSRKGRDLAVLSGLVIAVGAQFVNFGAQRLGPGRRARPRWSRPRTWLRWLPPAPRRSARWTRRADGCVRGGRRPTAAHAWLALAALLWLWQRSADAADDRAGRLHARGRRGPTRKDRPAARALARLLPAGRTGTVMQRSLRYIGRDPKTKAAWVTRAGDRR